MSGKKNFAIVVLIVFVSYGLLTAYTGNRLFLHKPDAPSKTAEIAAPGIPVGEPAKPLPAPQPPSARPEKPEPKGCVFRTVFGEESSDSMYIHQTPAKVRFSLDEALGWLVKAQLKNGGWGAGTHSRQGIMDPHAVDADPATTAMVSMAILRSGSTLTQGEYAKNLERALDYLLEQVENASANDNNITDKTGTQPQIKLGQNIDVVLTSQLFTNVLEFLSNDKQLKERVTRCNNVCLTKIQRNLADNGSVRGAGWAGVLQSSFATNALETAKDKGLKVDEEKLIRAREYQKSNYDVKTDNVSTEDGAGVMLYSVSGSARASAKEAREAKQAVAKAKSEGKVAADAPINAENLKKSGLSESEALRYETAYQINQAANTKAQQSDVMDGFGSNGGEEFLSYLQTGEGLIMSHDTDWKKWYGNITGRLVKIQNDDGSWNGHHCITSPVFCTATAVLILSVNNDVDRLMAKK